MIYVTGDTHGRFSRLLPGLYGYPELKAGDYLIICGDFGGIWSNDERENYQLDALSELPCTILFADGNHENYDLLDAYPVSEWQGGRVQFIRPNLIHLMRGQIYEIEGKSFFVMGGAACHDIWNGVLDMDEPDFERRYNRMRSAGMFFRIKGLSWWERELPTDAEIEEARKNLAAHGDKVDYVITHCAPESVQTAVMLITGNYSYESNRLTEFLEELRDSIDYKAWYCGHFHREMDTGRIHVLYESIVPLEE